MGETAASAARARCLFTLLCEIFPSGEFVRTLPITMMLTNRTANYRGVSMRSSGGFLVLTGLSAALLTGCALESPLSIRRVWGDYNTLKTPAVYYDKISHLPPDSVYAKEMRWMYNKGPHEVGANSLIPDPQGVTPLPAPYSPIKSPSTGDSAAPVPLPQTPIGPGSVTPPIPPLPSKTQIPTSPGTTSGPIAGRKTAPIRTAPIRTAQPGGTWRFIY